MPSYYIINLNKVNLTTNESTDLNYIIGIYSRKKVGIKEGDLLVLMSYSAQEEGYEFTAIAKVVSVKSNSEDLKPSGEEPSLFTLAITIEKTLEPPTSLNSVAFSLQKIYKYFNNPAKHVNRAYSIISKGDFTTLENQEVFYNRTAFGMIANQMHIQHRINFIKYFIETDPEAYLIQIDYKRGIDVLNSYINSHIIIPAQYLLAAYENLASMQEVISINELNDLSFSSAETDNRSRPTKRDVISSQAELITRYFSGENDILLPSTEQVIANSSQLENQDRFENLFSNTQYPIFIKPLNK